MTLKQAKVVAEEISRDSSTVHSVSIHNNSNMSVLYPWGSLTIRISDLDPFEAYKKAIELEDDSSFLNPNA
jgi:hypothetical protein